MNHKGFTLIEVMVSASILALLAAIIFANVNQGRVKAAEAKADVEMNQLTTATELYRSTYGIYPAREGYVSTSGLEDDLVPEFISKLPELSEAITDQTGSSGGAGANTDYRYYSDGEIARSGSTYFRCGPGNKPDKIAISYQKKVSQSNPVPIENQLHYALSINGPYRNAYSVWFSGSETILYQNYCIPQY